jgi:hypothetical protein
MNAITLGSHAACLQPYSLYPFLSQRFTLSCNPALYWETGLILTLTRCHPLQRSYSQNTD